MDRRPLLRRGALAVLILAQGSLALWALLAPRAFYDDFPGGGRSWVSPLGPYDEHLVRDVGALSLGLTTLFVAAAVWLDRRLVLVAALAYLAWELPHLAFHLTADDVLSTGDRIASEGAQVVIVLIALALAVDAVRERPQVTAPD